VFIVFGHAVSSVIIKMIMIIKIIIIIVIIYYYYYFLFVAAYGELVMLVSLSLRFGLRLV